MPILSLKKYRGRNPQGYFRDLPWEVRNRAYQWLHKFCTRWGSDLPAWRFAILVGQAKRLALNPPTSRWGRSMHAKRGGLATRKRYKGKPKKLLIASSEPRGLELQVERETVTFRETPNEIVYLPLWD